MSAPPLPARRESLVGTVSSPLLTIPPAYLPHTYPLSNTSKLLAYLPTYLRLPIVDHHMQFGRNILSFGAKSRDKDTLWTELFELSELFELFELSELF